MASKDVLLNVLEKFTSPYSNLTPFEKLDPEGRKLPPLSNLGMGYVFEELIRKFNEENNEEAGEHFTPREIIELMVNILFVEDSKALTKEGIVRTMYDPACGTGGMISKVDVAFDSSRAGIRTVIANASEKDVILNLAQGKKTGTLFVE